MFVFERLRSEDLPFLIEVRNECRHSLHDDREFTLDEGKTWLHEKRPDFHVIRMDGERIGYFRLSNHDRVNGSIYIGADLHSRFRGQGLARLAYEAFLPIVKDGYLVSVAKLEVLSHNIVAYRLYQKLGFVEIEREERYAERDGIWVDNISMSMTL